jgi:hypothetical protein
MGWNFDYDDAEIRSLEITLEDCEEVKLWKKYILNIGCMY